MPKVKTLQIVWHDKEPVYSLDFHPNGTLFTAGADKEVKAWEVSRGEGGYATVKHISTLTGHSKTVNCVRFSPTGSYLVSSGDSGEIMLWAPQQTDGAPRGNLVSAEEASATWRRAALLRGHSDDVMDLAWSADGSALLSGSIDNKVIVWDVSDKRRGQMLSQLTSHKHFVQGVAWDPAQQFVVSQSADRTCKVYSLRPPPAARRNKIIQYLQPACDTAKEFYCSHTLGKRVVAPSGGTEAAGAAAEGGKSERLPMFLDESAPTFFRRPAWSPDGSFLALPAGTHRSRTPPHDVNTAYLFARGLWANPVAHLPAQNKPVVAIRFCPILYRRNPSSPCPAPFDKLPYKMVFAVATLDSVVIYDTSSSLPLALLGQLHYDSITDLAWSKDGQYLAVSSRDCYCSIAAFQSGELGEVLPKEELPPAMAKRAAAAEAAALAVTLNAPAPAAAAVVEPRVSPSAAPTAAAATAAPPSSRTIEVQPKRRIQPEAITATTGATTAAPTAEPAAKKSKRINPVLVQPLGATPGAAGATTAATAAPTQEAGESNPKRITPTPVAQPSPRNAFESAKPTVAPAPRATTEGTSAAAEGKRRITPVPIAPSPGPEAAAPKPAMKPGSIAAMAMAAAVKEASKK